MEFREIVSVTGVSGLKKVVASRNDGLVLANLDGADKKFYSNRVHMFSPLDNISMYTDDNETVPLLDVMIAMKEVKTKTPPVSANSNSEELRTYLGKVLPNFDREKVNVSDIKKLVKWFEILEPLDVLKQPVVDKEVAAAESNDVVVETAPQEEKAKPAPKKAAAKPKKKKTEE